MRCLLLGGGGFIGSYIADRLLQLGHHVRIFDRPRVMPYRIFSMADSIEWLSGDFQSETDVQSAVQNIDIIFHLISTTFPKNSNENPVYDIESNVIGTLRVINACLRSSVRKVIFISSGGTVYGVPTEIPITESHATNPIVSYGICKLAIEKYLQLFHSAYGLEYYILRVSNPYGARQRIDTAQGAVTAFLKRILAGERIDIWGDGSVIRDYIYIDDVVDAFMKVLENNGEPRLFNIGVGQGLSINELIFTIEDVFNRKVIKRYLPARQFDVPVNILDISRAREYLGWQPKYSIREGLLQTVKSIQE
jgi:UDP-glucose 4-epimerase